MEYVVWVRTLVLIGILHMLLSRPSGVRSVKLTASSQRLDVTSPVPSLVRFPNLMR
jgi:hypothetical protein